MQLAKETKVRYSNNERRAFAVLPKNGRAITTVDIADKVYGKDRPYYARQTILGVMNGLQRKASANKEPFAIVKTKRRGPHPVEFSLEKKA